MRRLLPPLLGLMTACAFGEIDGDSNDPSGGKADDGERTLVSCPDREPELRATVAQLLSDITAGRRNDVRDVDEFLAALPEELRSNILFLTDTRSMAKVYPREEKERLLMAPGARSFHERDGKWCSTIEGSGVSCVESRVLVMSPEGDFVGSFTTHPDSPSRDRFELVLFDPQSSELTFFDVHFRASGPRVTRNPASCLQCHGGSDGTVNWRMDPYRFWAYATPFNEDFLRAGSLETDWYMSFMDRIEAGEDKLGRLVPFNAASQVADRLASAGSFQLRAPAAAVDFAGIDTPALNLSHQLLEKNACRAAASMYEREDFERIKYAALGALIDCENLDDFFPQGGAYTRESAEDYFAQMGEGLDGGQFRFETFLAENRARQERLLSDKLSRRFDHYAEFAGEQVALREIRDAIASGPIEPGYGVTNFESYGSQITRARYLLEPLGVDVTQWSMAVDPVAQSHVEFLHPFAIQPVFIEVLLSEFDDAGLDLWFDLHDCNNLDTSGPQGTAGSCYRHLRSVSDQLCPQLADRSREALAGHVPPAPMLADYEVEDIAELERRAEERAAQSSLAELRAQAGPVYQMCATCHEFAYASGPPWLPFRDLNLLDDLLRRERDASLRELDGTEIGIRRGLGRPHRFRHVTTADRIWDRITRHPRQHGMMPATRLPLTVDQKISIRAHMLKVMGE